jgi:hypothetical protein
MSRKLVAESLGTLRLVLGGWSSAMLAAASPEELPVPMQARAPR